MDTISIDVDARGIATLTLERAEKHNSMSSQMIADLTEAAERLGSDPAVRVVVLTGAGKSFCAGADLGWMKEQMAADAATRGAEARKLAEMLGALDRMPKPLIGKVNGQAYGGGLGMMSVCDVAVGVDSAKFAFTEAKLGLIPATIGPYVVARMGAARARRVFMSARVFGAAEAVDLGLLAKAVPAGELEAAVEAEVVPYLNCAPGAVARSKALIAQLEPRVTDAVVAMTIEALVDAWEGNEAPEGVSAFFEKRKPRWIEE